MMRKLDAPLPFDAGGATIFLSYSRVDSAQLKRVAAALVEAGYRPNYDNAPPSATDPEIGISAQDEWWLRLQDMIVGAEVTVLLVSPASARSRVVGDEIAFARGEGKRIIPVLCSPVDFSTAVPSLAALNVKISIADPAPDAFAGAMAQLCLAVDQDIEWLRTARVLNQKSREWRMAAQAPDQLLHGAAIAEAERWSARRPASAPPISEDILSFILASRNEEEQRVRQERAQLDRQRRMQRWIGALILLALAVTVIGTVLLFNRQRKLAHSESVMYARAAEELFTQGDYARAIRLSALGLADGPLRPGSPEADTVFRRSVLSPVLEREFPTSGAVTSVWAATDGDLMAFSASASNFGFWHSETETWAGGYTSDVPMSELGFTAAPQGRRFLSWGLDLKLPISGNEEEKDLARLGVLWKVDDAGNVTASSRQYHPLLGGLLPTDQGPILTWGRVSVTLWSGGFDQRLAEVRLGGAVETVLDVGDGKRVLVLLQDGRLEIRSVEMGRPLALLASGSVGRPARDIALSRSENLVLVVPTEGAELIALDLDKLAVRYRSVKQLCCVGAPQLAGLHDGSIVIINLVPVTGARLIRADNGESIKPLLFAHQAIQGASLDEAGERLVTFGTDNEAHVWDVKTGVRRVTIRQNDFVGNMNGPSGPPGGIKGAIFIDGGTELALWNDDGTIRIYSSATGEQLGGHMRHPGPVKYVQLLPGRRLMTASSGPVRIWHLPDYSEPVASIDELCASKWARFNVVRLFREVQGGAALSISKIVGDRAALGPTLALDSEDVQLVPILRGREGEALCEKRTRW